MVDRTYAELTVHHMPPEQQTAFRTALVDEMQDSEVLEDQAWWVVEGTKGTLSWDQAEVGALSYIAATLAAAAPDAIWEAAQGGYDDGGDYIAYHPKRGLFRSGRTADGIPTLTFEELRARIDAGQSLEEAYGICWLTDPTGPQPAQAERTGAEAEPDPATVAEHASSEMLDVINRYGTLTDWMREKVQDIAEALAEEAR